MKRILIVMAFLAFSLFSCSEDAAESTINEITFDHYTIDVTRAYSLFPASEEFVTGNIVDNKKYSITSEGQTMQQFFYSGGQLVSTVLGDQQTTFHYDGQQHLIGIDRIPENLNYRYQFISENAVYVERLNLPYDDPEAVPAFRCILEFDENDNVIAAGYDRNYDGIMDQANHFTYQNDDLIGAQIYDGTTFNYEYSTIADNFAVLDDNTYSKKIRRLMCAEHYSGPFTNPLDVANLSHSRHLLASEALAATYETFDNGYYQTKTFVRNTESPEAVITTKTEFFLNAD